MVRARARTIPDSESVEAQYDRILDALDEYADGCVVTTPTRALESATHSGPGPSACTSSR